MKKLISILLITSFIFTFVANNLINNVLAQMTPSQSQVSGPCVNLAYNQTIGSRDYNTNGEVTKLQIFLNSLGLLNHVPTGYFGVLTKAAVARYQTINSIYPNVGYLGPITRAKINQDTCNNFVPSTPSNQLSYYCDINGINYNNEIDYKNNCVKITYYYTCSINGQTYTNKADYDLQCRKGSTDTTIYFCALNNLTYTDINSYNQNCKSQTTIYYCPINNQNYYTQADYNYYCINQTPIPPKEYYCTINGQTYLTQDSYNQYCLGTTPILPICLTNNVYANTKTCACPTGYTFMSINNGFKCDNSNFACTMIYVPPYATSNTYDRCHYAYYCPIDNLYHNSLGYCNNFTPGQVPNNPYPNIPQTKSICDLDVKYQGGGFVATNDCVCPYNSIKVDLGNFGEVYYWKCISAGPII